MQVHYTSYHFTFFVLDISYFQFPYIQLFTVLPSVVSDRLAAKAFEISNREFQGPRAESKNEMKFFLSSPYFLCSVLVELYFISSFF